MINSNHIIPNTFGLEAKARELIEFSSVNHLRQVLAEHRGEKMLVVGSGSNLLLRGDYDGIVLRSGMRRVLSLTEDDESVTIDCGAGIVLDELIDQVCDMGLWGMENLSYIPGTVGASAVQNVGAYRTEAKDIITRVHVIEIETGEERVLSNEECQFGYRHSIFKDAWAGRYVVTSVEYRLHKSCPNPDEKRSLKAIRAEIIATRQAKLPEVSEYGSAGSFFMNPVVSAEKAAELTAEYPDMPQYPQADGVKLVAAWLIDQAGMKGCQVGGARVWDRQPLVIVNYDHATAEDIMTLAEQVMTAVEERFGIRLKPEVIYI